MVNNTIEQMSINNLPKREGIYDYCETKRKCEMLYSDIISFDTRNLNHKTKQWEVYNNELNKIVDNVSGRYNKLKKYDEIFSIGNKINIHYMSGIKLATIDTINVMLDTCTWHPEYTLIVKFAGSGNLGEIDHRICIHLADSD